MSNKVRKKTVTRALCDEAITYFKANYTNDVTCKAFCSNFKRFVKFCRERYFCTSMDECREHVSDYAGYLVVSNKY